MRRRSYLGVAAAMALLACTAFIDGCGSIACTETDTCAKDVRDATQPGDAGADATLRDGSTDASKHHDAPESDVRDAREPPDDAREADAPTDAPADVSDGPTEESDAPEDASDAQEGDVTDAPADATDATRDSPGGTDATRDSPGGTDATKDAPVETAPVCAGQCVPSWDTGSGWVGPIALFDSSQAGGPAPAPVGCIAASAYADPFPTAASAQLGNYGPTAVDPTCGCSCPKSVAGVTCSEPMVSGSSNGCPGTGEFPGLATSSCAKLTTNNIQSATVTPATLTSGGSCSPIETGLPVTPWNPKTSAGWDGTGNACWTGKAIVASGPSVGCATGEVCVPNPPSTFSNGAVCIYFGASAACPATGYTKPHTYYSGGTDTRSCSYTCSCTPAGVACDTAVTISTNSSCTGGTTVSATTTSVCTNLMNYNPVYTEAAVTTTGTCTFAPGSLSGGAAAEGQATPTGPVTVCCDK